MKLVPGEARIDPSGRLGVLGAGGAGRHAHQLLSACEVPLQPTQVRAARVGVQVRPQINHLLAGFDCLSQIPLLHQNIAEQAKIKGQPAPCHQLARQRLRFLEAMQIMQHVTAQQQGLRTVRAPRLKRQRALFGQFVESRIKTGARLLHKQPAQPFQCEVRISASAHLYLEPPEFSVQFSCAFMGSQSHHQRVGKTRLPGG